MSRKLHPTSHFHSLNSDLSIWHRYDPSVKTDLFSSALRLPEGWLLVDPTAPLPQELLSPGNPYAGILITNANHWRSAPSCWEKEMPIFAAAETALDPAAPCSVIEIGPPQTIFGQLNILAVTGAVPGEIALHHPAQRLLIMGDALINADPYGFSFLPSKYCANPREMRRSLRQLLELDFETILFAHGMPVLSGARTRLELLFRDTK